ncbi:MAG: TRAFs-binding domain-containing protein [Actinomycetota bacterium]|nr:TRAFs-binding domain-containing protein [Actinomycetota bacterium]
MAAAVGVGVGGRECLVLMPPGQPPGDENLARIDVDAVFRRAIEPAVIEAGCTPRRIDRTFPGPVVDASTMWRVLSADILVVDLTTTDPTVTYLLGVRHAARPGATLVLVGNPPGTGLDTGLVDAIRYEVTAGSLTGADADALRGELAVRLRVAAAAPAVDSPVFALLDGYPGVSLTGPVSMAAAQAERDAILAERLRDAAARGPEAVRSTEQEIGHLPAAGRAVLASLVTAYAEVGAWGDVIRVHDQLPSSVADDTEVRRRVAQALAARNGPGDGDAAIALLHRLIEASGGDAASLTALGRAYKERLVAAQREHDVVAAAIWLDEATDAFGRGFERDPGDVYAGVNAINLLVRKGTEEAMARVEQLAPVVTFAALRHGCERSEDYWTLATLLELALLGHDDDLASRVVERLVTVPSEDWMRETTASNISRLAELGGPDERTALLGDLSRRLRPPALAGHAA